jgi:hypothetical protein
MKGVVAENQEQAVSQIEVGKEEDEDAVIL